MDESRRECAPPAARASLQGRGVYGHRSAARKVRRRRNQRRPGESMAGSGVPEKAVGGRQQRHAHRGTTAVARSHNGGGAMKASAFGLLLLLAITPQAPQATQAPAR